MKETPLIRAIDDLIAIKMKAVDDYINMMVEPLSDVGSPEALLGKKYEMWTPQDKQVLYGIYGQELEKFIAKKEIEALYRLEQEVI